MEIFKNNDKVIFQHSRKEHHCTLEIERRFILIFLEIHIKCDFLSLRKSNVFSNVQTLFYVHFIHIVYLLYMIIFKRKRIFIQTK